MDLNIKKVIGVRIKELRKRKKITQEKLAENAEINVKYLSKIEMGTKNPTINVFIRIAESLDVDIGAIFNQLVVEDPAKRLPAINALLGQASEEQLKTVLKILSAILR